MATSISQVGQHHTSYGPTAQLRTLTRHRPLTSP
jgi:hypothetical protein